MFNFPNLFTHSTWEVAFGKEYSCGLIDQSMWYMYFY